MERLPPLSRKRRKKVKGETNSRSMSHRCPVPSYALWQGDFGHLLVAPFVPVGDGWLSTAAWRRAAQCCRLSSGDPVPWAACQGGAVRTEPRAGTRQEPSPSTQPCSASAR